MGNNPGITARTGGESDLETLMSGLMRIYACLKNS